VLEYDDRLYTGSEIGCMGPGTLELMSISRCHVGNPAARIRKPAVFILLITSFTTLAHAQQLVYPRARPHPITMDAVTLDVKRRLADMGYADIVFQEKSGELIGTATKSKRKVEIAFDHKGQLHVRTKSGRLQ